MLDLRISHYTTTGNYRLIKEQGFKKSLHSKDKYQWLGNGVYFFNTHDHIAKRKGKAIAGNKLADEEDHVVEVQIETQIPKNEILDLHCENDTIKLKTTFEEIAYKAATEGYQVLLESIDSFNNLIDHIIRFQPFNNEFYGKSLGTYINLIEYKSEDKISAVSARFYDLGKFNPKDQIEYSIKKNEQKSTEQICIKDLIYLDFNSCFRECNILK